MEFETSSIKQIMAIVNQEGVLSVAVGAAVMGDLFVKRLCPERI